MNAGRTARERARAELASEIKDEARRQLAGTGASGLSLRAVSRELGMVSSALYRYFPGKDELLTALIVDAYDALGEVAETADAEIDRTETRARWCVACRAVRAWAREHPHEYALLYGSPVPGYRAPETTVAPAARVALVLFGTLRDSAQADTLVLFSEARPTAGLAEQLRSLGESVAPELPASTLSRAVIAWTQLFGMISFEIFGHLVGSVDPSDDFFENAVGQMADFVGLPAR
jgi:AcrR family transcriptional regulator